MPEVLLAELTTFRLGGPAGRLVEATTEAELVDAVRAADLAGEPLLVVGGGSNLLVADEGFAGTVVRVATRASSSTSDACSGAMVEVAAGEPWDDVVERAIEEEWSGIEALSGIPGSTGATPAAERRRLRPGGRPDHRPGTPARPLRRDDPHGGCRRLRVRLPVQRVPARPALGRPRGDLPAAARRARALRSATPSWRVASASPRVARAAARDVRDGRPRAAPEQGHAARPRATTTRGAPGRSSSTRSSTPTPRPGCPRTPRAIRSTAGPRPRRPGWSSTPASTRGWGAGQVRVSTKHTLALTNRGAPRPPRSSSSPGRSGPASRTRFGVRLEPEPQLVGCTL